MSEHSPKVTLIDLLDAIDAILAFSTGIDYDYFISDRKTRDAIFRNIEVMGEAVNRLPEYFLNTYPNIPWSKMVSTRNALIHGYEK